MDDFEVEILRLFPESENGLLDTVEGFFHGLRPVEIMTVSEWADKYRMLSSIASPEPGKYKTSRTPYIRAVMDALSATQPYKKIVMMKGAQVGATEAANNFVGYAMHLNPSPILMVEPTIDMVKKLSKTRLDPMINMCPELKCLVSEKKSRDSNNTMTEKMFPGGVLILSGANSSANLRSQPVRFLILDEIDDYPADLNKQGSPIELARVRTSNFQNSKVFILSTPTVSGFSAIENEFELTDKNYYHVPCPHCGCKQTLIWSQLKWDEHKPETASYCCIHCGTLIDERYKTQMFEEKSSSNINGAEWIPSDPEKSNRESIGFHINSLYAPLGWKSWKDLAADFIIATKDPIKLKGFINTRLGETWAERGEAPAFKNIYNRRENYQISTIPGDVAFLTCGVDVQKDRIELEIVGWCKGKRSYSIDYRVLEGDTTQPAVWTKLGAIVDERWTRPDGSEMTIRMMAVDSGFNTTHVYDFCRRFTSRVIPIKGQDNLREAYAPPKPVDVTRAGKRIGKVRVWPVGSSFLKEELYSWLRLEKDENDVPPPCYCHFPEYGEHFFRSITAEDFVSRVNKRGYMHTEWVKKFDRNEALDCRIYARAAAAMVGLDRMKDEHFDALTGKIAPKPAYISKKEEDTPIELQHIPRKIPQRSQRYNNYWRR